VKESRGELGKPKIGVASSAKHC